MSGSRPEAEVVTRSIGTAVRCVLRLKRGRVRCHPVDQLLVGRREIGAARIRRIVSRSLPQTDASENTLAR